jgi:hypothetical protein
VVEAAALVALAGAGVATTGAATGAATSVAAGVADFALRPVDLGAAVEDISFISVAEEVSRENKRRNAF